MTRALVMVLVLALLVPAGASAATNGGVAAPAANGGTGAGSPSVVRAPATPKKHPKRKKKKRRPAPAPAPPAPAATSTHRFPVAGPFTWPGPGGEFGAGRPGHIHQGFDLLAPQGTPVVAPYAGTVTFVDYQAGGAGYYVVLHSDYDYAFMHLVAGSIRVKVGQALAAGDRIGDVGQTGDAAGPHLHFEVWKGPWQQGGTAIDPAPLLRSWD